MGDFNPNPFKGEASIPHVPEEIFSAVWLGWQVRLRAAREGIAWLLCSAAAAAVFSRTPHPHLSIVSRNRRPA